MCHLRARSVKGRCACPMGALDGLALQGSLVTTLKGVTDVDAHISIRCSSCGKRTSIDPSDMEPNLIDIVLQGKFECWMCLDDWDIAPGPGYYQFRAQFA